MTEPAVVDVLNRRLSCLDETVAASQKTIAELSATTDNIKNQLDDGKNQLDDGKNQLCRINEKEKTDGKWKKADHIVPVVVIVVTFVALVLGIYTKGGWALEHADDIRKGAAFASAIASIVVALISFLSDHLKKTLSAVTVLTACLSLGLVIYNPDSPSHHAYWDGQETIECTGDLMKMSRKDINPSEYKLLDSMKSIASKPSATNPQILVCTPHVDEVFKGK